MPRNTLGSALLALSLGALLCLCGGHPIDRSNGTLLLSIFGSNVRNGSWTTAFSLDKSSKNVSRNWNLRLYHNVSEEGPTNRMRFSGIFTDNLTDDVVNEFEPILVQMLPVTTKEDNSTNCTEVITGAGSTWEIISRTGWNAVEPKRKFEPHSKAADFVVLRQEFTRCFTKSICVELMKKLQRYSSETYDDVMSNFYVGDDGNIYEGRGWDSVPHRNLGGLEDLSLSVAFLGKFHEDLPSPHAIEAFKYLLEMGICLGKLSREYKLISHRLIQDYTPILGNMLNEEVKMWDHYTEEIDLERELYTAGQFPIVFREEWKAVRANKTFDSVSMPVNYVVVMSYLSRCFTRKACVQSMQQAQKYSYRSLGDVGLNFCIGDDGMAYEGRGWDSVPGFDLESLGKKYIIVGFFGHYQTFPPSSQAILAFNKFLKMGVWLGKVSPDYKLLFHQVIKSEDLGKSLEGELKKLDRFSGTI